ncbi:MAG: magnesium chelatase subunit H [Oxalobacteraceae bacterium]|nr:magnesium chelatase subunit H [Oxalobacteraceae bacterium]
MTRKPTTAADSAMRVVIVTMDNHLAGASARAARMLQQRLPTVSLSIHAASEWADDPSALARCKADIASGDIVIASMLFMEDHFTPVLADLQARRDHCDAMVCIMSAGEVMRLTRLGRFSMDGSTRGPMAFLKKLRGKSSDGKPTATAGAQQMKMLRRLPKLLRFIPGTAQDVRAYFLTLQYWLAGSEENIAGMVQLLVNGYAEGARKVLRGKAPPSAPVEYPEVGLYHPRMKGAGVHKGMGERIDRVPAVSGAKASVGLLLMRSYLLAGNARHYDGVIASLEARGLSVLPAYASGLDARPAIEQFFMKEGRATVDAVISLTGFSLVGGPAYNDAKAAEEMLSALDVPYMAVTPVEFQTIEHWGGSERGLLPVEATMMVALPELDGSSGSLVYGGRSDGAGSKCTGCSRGCTFEASDAGQDMQPCSERSDMIAARVDKMVALRRSERAERRVAVVLFNFPPNAGGTGTAAFLAVFESLFNTLGAMKRAGYSIDLPEDVDALRRAILNGNSEHHGAPANVLAKISADDHVRREPWLREIEAQWGPAPGKHLTDGRSIFVLGARFGNVMVSVQPSIGVEGDPMRLLFDKGFAPTHAFSAFYRYLREDFAAHAVLHFGTHGALEFMPGKQAGMSGACWPDRLIADMPNVYLYAANNPSEGTIAKRRANATLVSYVTPPLAEAGLYRGLNELKASLSRWRQLGPEEAHERPSLAAMIQSQACELELAKSEPAWDGDSEAVIMMLNEKLLELEYTLIPHGLHVVGRAPTVDERVDMLLSIAEAAHGATIDDELREAIRAMLTGSPIKLSEEQRELMQKLSASNELLHEHFELDGMLTALDGRYVRPAPGGDMMRSPEVLPAGRNLHGFDPFRLPSAYAVKDGARQAERLLAKHHEDTGAFPESIAMVLWGTDNLKSEGGPIAQALALMGTAPRFDSYGRLAGAQLLPIETLGRPRVDVMITLSGIFRDLLPLQVRMLAEAALLAAQADEPPEQNFIRKHVLAWMAEHGGDIETAALRVFGNAEGTYGANVNHLIDCSRWDDEDELAEAWTCRKGFAYGTSGRPVAQPALLNSVLSRVELAYQNLDSVEVGVTTIDTYFDTLGGISRAVKRAKGPDAAMAPVYIGDQTRGGGTVRTLSEQVALETRTRTLNPKWYEGMLAHGYEGVHQIELHLTNTMGWSATTGQVQPWVYQQLTQTFLLDPEMRERLARLNPSASARVASRLMEAYERNYWTPDADTLDAMRRAGEELEDRLEGIYEGDKV